MRVSSSNFTKFAGQFRIPLFEDVVLRDSQTTGIIKKPKLGVIG